MQTTAKHLISYIVQISGHFPILLQWPTQQPPAPTQIQTHKHAQTEKPNPHEWPTTYVGRAFTTAKSTACMRSRRVSAIKATTPNMPTNTPTTTAPIKAATKTAHHATGAHPRYRRPHNATTAPSSTDTSRLPFKVGVHVPMPCTHHLKFLGLTLAFEVPSGELCWTHTQRLGLGSTQMMLHGMDAPQPYV